jgi:DDE superfamily endonuclease
VYHTTGLSRDDVVELCAMIHSAGTGPEDNTWPPSLGLFNSVVITLTYMRRNRVQEELAETYRTSQSTVSRAISAVTVLIKKVLTPYVPTADELDGQCQYLIDGTLLPCWSWAAHPELYSGKHKTTGMNVQVACTLAGKLAWISDPVEGSRHDNHCLKESGALFTVSIQVPDVIGI